MASINRESINERLDYIKEQEESLQALVDAGELDEELGRGVGFNGVVRMLQTSIEAMIEIAYHLSAKLYAIAPDNSRHAFEILWERGDIPDDFIVIARRMVGFRNIVVHGYLKKNIELVKETVINHLSDFDTWEQLVADIVAKKVRG